MTVFATIPSLERRIRSIAKLEPRPVVIVDLAQTHRLDTAIVRYLERQAREMASQSWPAPMILAGVVRNSGIHADLERGGVTCNWIDHAWPSSSACESEGANTGCGLPTFDTLKDALRWTKTRTQGIDYDSKARHENSREDVAATVEGGCSEADIVSAFRCLLTQDLADLLFSHLPDPGLSPLQRLKGLGIRVKRPALGELIICKGEHCILDGNLCG